MHTDDTMLSIVLMTVSNFKMIYFYWKSGQMSVQSHTKCEFQLSSNKQEINYIAIATIVHTILMRYL